MNANNGLPVAGVTRQFIYNGRVFPDPDSGMSPEQVREFYSGIHADLVNAAVEGGEFDGTKQTWTFRRGVGTKG